MKDIPGFEGLYAVTEEGKLWSHRTQKWMRAGASTDEYCAVGLLVSSSPKRYKHFRLHQLVLQTFVGECPEGHTSAHLNNDKTDNRLCNLSYVPHKENMSHQYAHGTRAGCTKRFAKEDYIKMAEAYKSGLVCREVAVKFNTTERHVQRVLREYLGVQARSPGRPRKGVVASLAEAKCED